MIVAQDLDLGCEKSTRRSPPQPDAASDYSEDTLGVVFAMSDTPCEDHDEQQAAPTTAHAGGKGAKERANASADRPSASKLEKVTAKAAKAAKAAAAAKQAVDLDTPRTRPTNNQLLYAPSPSAYIPPSIRGHPCLPCSRDTCQGYAAR